VSVATKPLQPPERFTIPLPGLVFICTPARAPRVFAVKSRPTTEESMLYNAPFFNTYDEGTTCAGTQIYSEDITQQPREFFMSFFSLHLANKRSKSHPDSLFALWQELDGKKEYPLSDLIEYGPLKGVI
jgi:hypothetical protein